MDNADANIINYLQSIILSLTNDVNELKQLLPSNIIYDTYILLLPHEIIDYICSYISFNDVARFSLTCKRIRNVFSIETIRILNIMSKYRMINIDIRRIKCYFADPRDEWSYTAGYNKEIHCIRFTNQITYYKHIGVPSYERPNIITHWTYNKLIIHGSRQFVCIYDEFDKSQMIYKTFIIDITDVTSKCNRLRQYIVTSGFYQLETEILLLCGKYEFNGLLKW